MFAGGKVNYEEVKATPYSDLKAEVISGKLEPLAGKIAERIHTDQLSTVNFSQAKKIAIQVVKKLNTEGVINRPSDPSKTGQKGSPDVPDASGSKTGVKTGERVASKRVSHSQNMEAKMVLKGDAGQPDKTENTPKFDPVSFDKIYVHVSGKVKSQKVNISLKSVKNCVNDYVSNNSQIEALKISIVESQKVANAIINRLHDEGVIIDNPDYRNGLPKYLVV